MRKRLARLHLRAGGEADRLVGVSHDVAADLAARAALDDQVGGLDDLAALDRARQRDDLNGRGRAAGEPQRAARGGAGRHVEGDVEASAAAVVIEIADARVAFGGGFHLDGAQLAVEIHHDVFHRAERVLRRQRLRDAVFDVFGREWCG